MSPRTTSTISTHNQSTRPYIPRSGSRHRWACALLRAVRVDQLRSGLERAKAHCRTAVRPCEQRVATRRLDRERQLVQRLLPAFPASARGVATVEDHELVGYDDLGAVGDW